MTAIGGPGPVIVSLTQFVKNNLTTLVEGNSTESTTIFNKFFAEDVKITLNGQSVSRDHYMKQLREERFDELEQSATVKFLGEVEVPVGSVSCDKDIGIVGVFYEATVYESIKVLGQSVTRIITSSMNVTVKQIQSGIFPQRHVVAVNQVSTITSPPITLPGQQSSST